jgi:uncharacterized Rmd1/YagE family protein
MFETECLHTPYLPPPTSSSGFRSPALKAAQSPPVPEGDLLNLNSSDNSIQNFEDPPQRSTGPRRKTGFSKRPGGKEGNGSRRGSKADTDHADSGDDDDFEEEEWVPDVFLFEYGTVVIWGMTEREEKAFLRSL